MAEPRCAVCKAAARAAQIEHDSEVLRLWTERANAAAEVAAFATRSVYRRRPWWKRRLRWA